MKMTEEEAMQALGLVADDIDSAHHIMKSGDTAKYIARAIRTVCDALEGARRAVPVGYVVLPRECDERMIEAFNECAAAGNEYPDTFLAALVAAAPAQPTVESIIEAFEAGRQSDDCINQYQHGTAEHTAFVHGVNQAYAVKQMLAQLPAQPATETAGDARDAKPSADHVAKVWCALLASERKQIVAGLGITIPQDRTETDLAWSLRALEAVSSHPDGVKVVLAVNADAVAAILAKGDAT